eukprot:scaffold24012_cov186-Cylindrotheca_fusiformis.AAC.5
MTKHSVNRKGHDCKGHWYSVGCCHGSIWNGCGRFRGGIQSKFESTIAFCSTIELCTRAEYSLQTIVCKSRFGPYWTSKTIAIHGLVRSEQLCMTFASSLLRGINKIGLGDGTQGAKEFSSQIDFLPVEVVNSVRGANVPGPPDLALRIYCRHILYSMYRLKMKVGAVCSREERRMLLLLNEMSLFPLHLDDENGYLGTRDLFVVSSGRVIFAVTFAVTCQKVCHRRIRTHVGR